MSNIVLDDGIDKVDTTRGDEVVAVNEGGGVATAASAEDGADDHPLQHHAWRGPHWQDKTSYKGIFATQDVKPLCKGIFATQDVKPLW